MNTQTFKTLGSATVLSLIFFTVVMGAAMGCVMLNARWSPGLVWFPLPVIALLIYSTLWAEKRWDIRLNHPQDIPLVRIYLIAIAITVFGSCVSATQGVFTDKVRAVEVYSADVIPMFRITYAFLMSVFAAVLAEVTFRGIMQTRVHSVLSVWPAIAFVAFINLVAHRWGLALLYNAVGVFVILATWTYLRWVSRSLWPPLVAHTLHNLVFAAAVWFGGPIEYGKLSGGVIAVIVFVGLASLGVTIMLAKDLHRARLEASTY
jgi:membrane protease YdiL (CAAX protease family)